MEAKDHPKPNDEVQLAIETVTPDTEKDVKPTEDITAEQSKEQESLPEDSKDQQEKNTETVNSSTENDESENTAEDHPAAVEDNKSGDEPNDARDQVETISP